MEQDKFFPPREDREENEEISKLLPWPLNEQYEKVHTLMDKEEPVHAALQIRDCWETMLKLMASLSVADYIQPQVDFSSDKTKQIFACLLKGKGISLGDWVRVLDLTLKGTPRTEFSKSLQGIFYEKNDKHSELRKLFEYGQEGFVYWRNSRIGHGIFIFDLSVYAKDVLRWLKKFQRAVELSVPFFKDLRIISQLPNEQNCLWDKVSPLDYYHKHVGKDDIFEAYASLKNYPLQLSPLLSVQKCIICKKWSAFFLHQYQSKKHKAIFLDFIWIGEQRPRKGVKILQKWESCAGEIVDSPEDMEDAFEAAIKFYFKDFDKQFEAPLYIGEQIKKFIRSHESGVVYLAGVGGVGKTWCVRGLAQMLHMDIFHVHLHDTINASQVITQIEQSLRNKEQVIPKVPKRATGENFARWLAKISQENRQLDKIIIAIDGLDEIAVDSDVPNILSSLQNLPLNCFIVLTGRSDLNEHVQKAVNILLKDPSLSLQIVINSEAPEYRKLLHDYADNQLPQKTISGKILPRKWISDIIEKAEGKFLYVAHYCHKLAFGIYKNIDSLPRPEEYYPSFFKHLEKRAGVELFENCYARTLALLSVVKEPVSISFLHRLGVEEQRSKMALLEFADMLDTSRSFSGEKLYFLKHNILREFLASDPSWAQMQETAKNDIIVWIREFEEDDNRWADLDITESVDHYRLSWYVYYLISKLKNAPSSSPEIVHAVLNTVANLDFQIYRGLYLLEDVRLIINSIIDIDFQLTQNHRGLVSSLAYLYYICIVKEQQYYDLSNIWESITEIASSQKNLPEYFRHCPIAYIIVLHLLIREGKFSNIEIYIDEFIKNFTIDEFIKNFTGELDSFVLPVEEIWLPYILYIVDIIDKCQRITLDKKNMFVAIAKKWIETINKKCAKRRNVHDIELIKGKQLLDKYPEIKELYQRRDQEKMITAINDIEPAEITIGKSRTEGFEDQISFCYKTLEEAEAYLEHVEIEKAIERLMCMMCSNVWDQNIERLYHEKNLENFISDIQKIKPKIAAELSEVLSPHFFEKNFRNKLLLKGLNYLMLGKLYALYILNKTVEREKEQHRQKLEEKNALVATIAHDMILTEPVNIVVDFLKQVEYGSSSDYATAEQNTIFYKLFEMLLKNGNLEKSIEISEFLCPIHEYWGRIDDYNREKAYIKIAVYFLRENQEEGLKYMKKIWFCREPAETESKNFSDNLGEEIKSYFQKRKQPKFWKIFQNMLKADYAKIREEFFSELRGIAVKIYSNQNKINWAESKWSDVIYGIVVGFKKGFVNDERAYCLHELSELGEFLQSNIQETVEIKEIIAYNKILGETICEYLYDRIGNPHPLDDYCNLQNLVWNIYIGNLRKIMPLKLDYDCDRDDPMPKIYDAVLWYLETVENPVSKIFELLKRSYGNDEEEYPLNHIDFYTLLLILHSLNFAETILEANPEKISDLLMKEACNNL